MLTLVPLVYLYTPLCCYLVECIAHIHANCEYVYIICTWLRMCVDIYASGSCQISSSTVLLMLDNIMVKLCKAFPERP